MTDRTLPARADRKHTTGSSRSAARHEKSIDQNVSQGDDAAPPSGPVGIGLVTSAPFFLGASRSAELLQLFIENL